VNNVPEEWTFSAFSLGREQLPYVALAAVAGGNARVGLEDNLYLDRGQLATNETLTARAKKILESLNFEVIGPARVREMLELVAHHP
ncbi:MAG: 3-keto-5-aminohexanoate cleavage protein, partial [Actinomycetota bacterium]|nr:3-keto-5-aminohexanoate cleavage protein [Actinomycetota bacterium]MEC9316727.1 3-keto-5-aminohexanoate cleavage protein [Actinomycetota bacterium]